MADDPAQKTPPPETLNERLSEQPMEPPATLAQEQPADALELSTAAPPELAQELPQPLDPQLAAELAPGPPPELARAPALTSADALGRLYTRVERFIPWISLGLSVAGVIAVDRDETKGATVAAGAVLGWVVLSLASLLQHRSGAASTGALRKAARFAVTSASQSMLQLSLFFCAPFYLEASAWTLPQCAFAVVFAVAAGLTCWDPWFERALLHPLGGSLLTAFASFVAWNAALPMLGLPQTSSLWMAAAGVSVAVPITKLAQGARGSVLRGALVASALLPLLLWLGAARAIPPAPLRVVRAALGTHVVERELDDPTSHFTRGPDTLLCFTAIRAPHGLDDALEHVWRLDGKEIHRIALKVHGGRRRGFRTWSRLRGSRHLRGTVRCDVATHLGQELGGAQATIGAVVP